MKKFLIAALLLLAGSAAIAQSGIFSQTYPLAFYQTGFREINGQQLNRLVAEVNSLTGFSTTQFPLNKVTGTTGSFTGHLTTGAVPPVLSSCGTTPTVVGSDTAGLVTMGTGSPTGCVITFATAYVSTPFCSVDSQSQLTSFAYIVSNLAITLTQTGTSSNLVNYICIGQAGG